MENTMNKTIYLVTGAAGFLGGTICRQLIERGNKVRGGTWELFPASNYSCLSYFSHILHDFPLFAIKKLQITSEKPYFYLMFFLNSRGRNCSIFPSKILLFGSRFLKRLVQTVVSFI